MMPRVLGILYYLEGRELCYISENSHRFIVNKKRRSIDICSNAFCIVKCRILSFVEKQAAVLRPLDLHCLEKMCMFFSKTQFVIKINIDSGRKKKIVSLQAFVFDYLCVFINVRELANESFFFLH